MAILSSDVTAGQQALASQYNNLRADVINANISFDTQTTGLVSGTDYQAGVNGGFLTVATLYSDNTNTIVEIFSDSNTTPTTLIARGRGTGATQIDVSITVPILPDKYYKFTSTTANYVGYFTYKA